MEDLCSDFESTKWALTDHVESMDVDTTAAPSPTGSSASAATTVIEVGKEVGKAKREPEPHQLRVCHKCQNMYHWRTMKAQK
eukprot:6527873-Alexandrium_andersonii.AAC.1